MTRTIEMTPRQAAQKLGMRLDSIYSLIWAGRLIAFKRDGRWWVAASSVDARLKQREARNV
jgi:hypothetical protein